jgi:hypothetical protein
MPRVIVIFKFHICYILTIWPCANPRFWPLAKPFTWSEACVSLFRREAQAQRGLPAGLPETQAERLHVKGGQNLIETDRPPPASGNPETGGGAGGYKNRGNHQPFGELAVDLYIRSGTPPISIFCIKALNSSY